MPIGGAMCREIIYFCAELLNYWTLMFWGLKFFIRVYRYDLSVSKEENNFIYLMICLPMALLGAGNYTYSLYTNFFTHLMICYLYLILKIINKNKISLSLVALYVFVMRLIDLWVVTVIEETNKISRHIYLNLTNVSKERVIFLLLLSVSYYIIFKWSMRSMFVSYLHKNKLYRRILCLYSYLGVSCFSIVYRFNYREYLLGYWTFYLICAFVLIGACLIYFIEIKNKERERLLNMRNDLLESNYKRLKKVYDENRTIQHDHKNHVLAISELIKEDKNYEALNYIHTYIKFTKNSLNDVKSGNDIVDIIVHSKYVEAKEKNINFIFDVDFLGNVPIRDIDMCALLANLLDNSIEACEKVKENSRDVSLKICKRNEMLVIRITNSIHSNLSKRRDIFKTEKENKQLHGWGMRSIEYVVKKYDGTKRYYIEGNRIEILVIIPI